jgi:hypothetical protein
MRSALNCNIAKKAMGHDVNTIKEADALVLRVWREAYAFFLCIELWLMVLVAVITVAGVRHRHSSVRLIRLPACKFRRS